MSRSLQLGEYREFHTFAGEHTSVSPHAVDRLSSVGARNGNEHTCGNHCRKKNNTLSTSQVTTYLGTVGLNFSNDFSNLLTKW